MLQLYALVCEINCLSEDLPYGVDLRGAAKRFSLFNMLYSVSEILLNTT
jgi:hypothetical protein